MSEILLELRQHYEDVLPHALNGQPWLKYEAREAYSRWFRQACLEGRKPDRLVDPEGMSTAEIFAYKCEEGADHTYWTGGKSIRLDNGTMTIVERYVVSVALGRPLDRWGEVVVRTCSAARCVRPEHLEVTPKRRQRLGQAEAIARLRFAARALGHSPRSNVDQGKFGCPHHTTIAKLFGSWTEGLEAAGLSKNENAKFEKVWTEARILEGIRSQVAEGKVPRYGVWEREHISPSAATIKRHFGSFRNGLRAAGVVK